MRFRDQQQQDPGCQDSRSEGPEKGPVHSGNPSAPHSRSGTSQKSLHTHIQASAWGVVWGVCTAARASICTQNCVKTLAIAREARNRILFSRLFVALCLCSSLAAPPQPPPRPLRRPRTPPTRSPALSLARSPTCPWRGPTSS